MHGDLFDILQGDLVHWCEHYAICRHLSSNRTRLSSTTQTSLGCFPTDVGHWYLDMLLCFKSNRLPLYSFVSTVLPEPSRDRHPFSTSLWSRVSAPVGNLSGVPVSLHKSIRVPLCFHLSYTLKVSPSDRLLLLNGCFPTCPADTKHPTIQEDNAVHLNVSPQCGPFAIFVICILDVSIYHSEVRLDVFWAVLTYQLSI